MSAITVPDITYLLLLSAVYFAFAFAAALIAKIKNRDALTYGVIGFFLAYIGVIIALAEPSIRINNLICRYLDPNKKKGKIVRGRLVPSEDGISFTARNKADGFFIPFSEIVSTSVYTKRTRPAGFPLPGKMFGLKNLLVLEVVHTIDGSPATSYFSIYKTAAREFDKQIIETGVLRSELQKQIEINRSS